jgi:hypothetical protein
MGLQGHYHELFMQLMNWDLQSSSEAKSIDFSTLQASRSKPQFELVIDQ